MHMVVLCYCLLCMRCTIFIVPVNCLSNITVMVCLILQCWSVVIGGLAKLSRWFILAKYAASPCTTGGLWIAVCQKPVTTKHEPVYARAFFSH